MRSFWVLGFVLLALACSSSGDGEDNGLCTEEPCEDASREDGGDSDAPPVTFICPAADTCGADCCEDAEVCLAGSCVISGDECLVDTDCDTNSYCEPALGSGDEPTPHTDPLCTLLPQRDGRCVALPAVCAEGTTGPDCLPVCEFRPDAAALEAEVAWTWNPAGVDKVDIWSTPAVARMHDANCDGKLDSLDPPNVIFVSSDVKGTCCHCAGEAVSSCRKGVLRVLDGSTGKQVWQLDRASIDSTGFAGISVAVGDFDRDGQLEIAAMTGEGKVAIISHEGAVVATSTVAISYAATEGFGWGGALAVADMDGDGNVEIAYGATVFTFDGTNVTLRFAATGGLGGGQNRALSTFANVDADADLELVAGKSMYEPDGTRTWHRADLAGDGFPGVADLDMNGTPEVVYVSGGKVYVLAGSTGASLFPAFTLTGDGAGGPPTIADFDGDGKPEIGIATKNVYIALKPNLALAKNELLWQTPNHDISSSVTGSTVFDFEGDGRAEVVYNDECFLWVYDGVDGHVRFATPTTSFTATESSLVADIDGDGHAELLMIANGVDPSANGWKCDVAPWNQPDPATGRPAWTPPAGATTHRGMTMFRDVRRRWVGTRTIWNQHTYHVSNVCDGVSAGCSGYGTIPAREPANWATTGLNNFRQNIQLAGVFGAPDMTVSLRALCGSPVILEVSVRNIGQAVLPAGAQVRLHRVDVTAELGTTVTTRDLRPGQTQVLTFTTDVGNRSAEFMADTPTAPLGFQECRSDNNASQTARAVCLD